MRKRLLIALLPLIIIIACVPQELKDECNILKGQTTIDNCYFEKAISTANITFCEKITMEPLKEVCISEIGIAMNNLNLCENLGEKVKGSCYTKIAINNQNESLCSIIESDYWWDICHYEVGVAKNDENICSEMDVNSERRDDCFREIAESKQDETICSWIGKENEKYFCYIELALIKGNISICNWIDNSIWRNGNCIKKVAENLSDASICELITVSNIKQGCLGKFNLN